jgi:hypothetical protein
MDTVEVFYAACSYTSYNLPVRISLEIGYISATIVNALISIIENLLSLATAMTKT